jgi:hypothetical protein
VADVTVARAQREEMHTLTAETSAEADVQSFQALPRLLVVLWVGSVLATVAFLAMGTLRVGAGNWIGRQMLVRVIWSRFLEFLTDLGASGPLIFLVTAVAIAALVLSAVGLWLALGLRDAPPDPVADTTAGV